MTEIKKRIAEQEKMVEDLKHKAEVANAQPHRNKDDIRLAYARFLEEQAKLKGMREIAALVKGA